MAGDTAKHALRRQLLLAPAMDRFVRAVRIKDAFLFPAQVVTKQPMNKHNELMHGLGKAMLEMGLIGARQSRAVAWSTFSQSVEVGETYTPWPVRKSGNCHCGLLAKPLAGQFWPTPIPICHPCGMIVPALVERAWSVHRKGSKSMTVESDCPLASESCVKVHILPLEKTSGGGYRVHSQLRSLSVNPHHADGIILYELPPRSVQVREADVYLTVIIAKVTQGRLERGGQLPTTVANPQAPHLIHLASQ